MSTSLHQWLPVISKKTCKWVLCLMVIKNYYGSLRVMSVTWNIGVFITFNIAVTIVRCSASQTNIFYWISSLTFWKVGSRRPITSELPLTWSFTRQKTPLQMFLAFLAENASVECNQASLSSQTPQTYFESSTHL